MKRLTFKNTSLYPRAALTILIDFALKETEAAKFVSQISVTNCRHAYRGRCNGSRILLRIGSTERFNTPVKVHYRKRAPAYELADWKEALVSLAAHEFTHARHFATGHGLDEVACEFSAHRVLLAFRERRAEIDARLLAAVEKDRVRLTSREEKKRAKAEALAHPSTKLAAIDAKIAAWERKLKTAETYLKKYRRAQARLARKFAAVPAEAPLEKAA